MVSDVIPSNASLLNLTQGEQPSAVKFDLYVKTREMKQLEQSLKHILLLPKSERQIWLQDHEELVNDLLESFVSDSTLALDGLQLDSEAMKLSVDFVTTLRDVMNTIRGILEDAQSLSS